VREFLSVANVPFEDRNIRRSDAHREELADRTGSLVVPQLVWGDRRIVGFDPDALADLVREYRESAA
jgi:glutaredoxin